MRGRKSSFLVVFAILFLIVPFVSAGSVQDEIQKITHYAEEYETGNINYVQLLLHTSAVRAELNEQLGVIDTHHGGLLKQDQIESVLGEPFEETKWVWVEGADYETKLDQSVPIWNKIVFDGKKIQIKLDAYPSVFYKGLWDFDYEDFETEEEIRAYEELKKQELRNKVFTAEDVIYRLHFNIVFKRPDQELNIPSKIDQITDLAQAFNDNPSRENAERLAKESVAVEKLFWDYRDQTQGNCEELMSSIFGEENRRQTQNLYVQEIDFHEGEKFRATARLEMCDDCEWSWIHLDIWIDTRGRHKGDFEEEDFKEYNREEYASWSDSDFQSEIRELIQEIMLALDSGDFSKAHKLSNELRHLNQAWNDVSNDVWKQIDLEFALQESAMTEQQMHQMHEDFGWIKREQERRQREKELRLINYETRKQFYLDLFEGYDKKEYYYKSIEFEKRLIQEFQVRGREICNNNEDDNDNGEIDCQEDQCGGQICGKTSVEVTEGNLTKVIEKDMYCIESICQLKSEDEKPEGPVCGNNICEPGEDVCSSSIVECTEDGSECLATADCGLGYCPSDCVLCEEHPPLNCSGKVVFSGEDENGCPLPPICLEDVVLCNADEDCIQPLCGVAECIRMEPEDEFGKCEVTEMKLCEEAECLDGEERVVHCDSGETFVKAICVEGIWNELEDVYCEEHSGKELVEEIPVEEEIAGQECVYQSDCGGENDVCSNGHCVTIPQTIQEPEEDIEVEVPEPTPEEEAQEDQEVQEIIDQATQPETPDSEKPSEEVEETPEESNPVTGEVVGSLRKFFMSFLSITGSVTEEGTTTDETIVEEPPPEEPTEETPQEDPTEEPSYEEGEYYEDEYYDEEKDYYPEEEHYEDEYYDHEKEERERHEREQRDREREEKEHKERMERECEDHCENNCYHSEVRPCVEECVWENCGEELDCNVDSEKEVCESRCKQDNNFEGCIDECVPKCASGEQYWEPKEQEHKEEKFEKGVFQVGGGCRTTQGRTESHLWFGGWGEPFEQIEPLKRKYYNEGEDTWCKYELENLIKQRREFEKGFNQEFVEWFFDKYMANSAENWEQHLSGIYELYWANVDNLREMSHRMDCLGMQEFPTTNLIGPIIYESDFGRIEYWEEMKVVKMPMGYGPDGKEEVEKIMITPYMKTWIFPPKEFIVYELQDAMENQRFPGPSDKQLERENEEGLTQEEKQAIKQNEDFIRKISEIADKYGGTFDLNAQLVDPESSEVVFNIYIKVNEEDIVTLQPMKPEDVPAEDAKIVFDFDKVYELIYSIEKEMKEEHVESPEWDRKYEKGGIKEVTQGIRMFFKVRDMINDADVYPDEAERDTRKLIKEFLRLMLRMGGDFEGDGPMGDKQGPEMSEMSEDEMQAFEDLQKEFE